MTEKILKRESLTAFLVVCVLFLLPVLFAGCKKEAAKEVTEHSKADTLELLSRTIGSLKCPLEIDADFKLDSVGLSAKDSLLFLKLTVDDDLLDSVSVADAAPVQEFMLGAVAQNGYVASLLKFAKCVPVSVRLQLTGAETGQESGFELTAQQLRALSVEIPELRRRDEIKVANRVKWDNAECPFEIEEGAQLLSISIQDRYVTFRTEIDVEKLDFMVMKENRDSVNHAVVAGLREQLQDSLQRKSLLDISDARMGYRNRYIASDHRDSFDISFTPDDLRKLISVADSLARESNTKKRK